MSGTTGYAEIAEHFRSLIRDGGLAPGERMPSLRSVMDTWGVSNMTAVRAYRALKSEGLTKSSSGAGTIVAHRGSSGVIDRVRAYKATGRALVRDETSEILEISTIQADEALANQLDVDPGSRAHVRVRLVRRNGVPVHMSSSYYAPFVIEVTPELTLPVSTGGSSELAAERLGSPRKTALEEVTSRPATDREREILDLDDPAIVTHVERTVYLDDGRVVEAAVKVCPGSVALRWSTPLG